jgi:hypothetical protein
LKDEFVNLQEKLALEDEGEKQQSYKTTASGACRVTPEASCAAPASDMLGQIT